MFVHWGLRLRARAFSFVGLVFRYQGDGEGDWQQDEYNGVQCAEPLFGRVYAKTEVFGHQVGVVA